jgi:hypothetical protein
MILDVVQQIAVVFVFAGVWCISIPQFKGQWYMLIAQSFWIWYAVGTKQWPLTVQSVVLFAINIKAIHNWKNKNIG